MPTLALHTIALIGKIGDPNVATGTGAVAIGADNTATGDGAVAIGNMTVAGD